MSVLSACASPEHRAALQLTGVLLGADVSPSLIADVSQSDISVLVGLLNAHHLHTALFAIKGRDPRLDRAIPKDLWLYWQEMQNANAARRLSGIEQIKWLGEHFQKAGIAAIALKGAADMIAPFSSNSAWRFVSDLDILILDDRAGEARQSLAELGAEWEPSPQGAAFEHRFHHLPPITLPGWAFPVELHLRPGQPIVCKALTNNQIDQAALAAVTGFSVPCLRHRYIHHVLHTANGRGDGDPLYLRAIMDHAAFNHHLPRQEKALAQAALSRQGLLQHSDRLDAVTSALMNGTMEGGTAPARKWARRAFRHFGNPAAKRRKIVFDTVSHHIAKLARDKDYRRYVAHILRKPGGLASLKEELAARRRKAR